MSKKSCGRKGKKFNIEFTRKKGKKTQKVHEHTFQIVYGHICKQRRYNHVLLYFGIMGIYLLVHEHIF